MIKILVVDDNAGNLTMISGILNGFFKVYPVNSGAMALKFLEKNIPDLILLDIEMPVMSGSELFNIIKDDVKLSAVPVIFLTAHGDTDSEAQAFKLGAADFIRKPVNDVILLARIRLHLEIASLRRNMIGNSHES